MDDRTRRTLEDLLAFAAMGARLVDRGHDAYLADEALRLASEAVLRRVGDAVARLDQAFLDRQPSVRWRARRAGGVTRTVSIGRNAWTAGPMRTA